MFVFFFSRTKYVQKLVLHDWVRNGEIIRSANKQKFNRLGLYYALPGVFQDKRKKNFNLYVRMQ